MLRIQPAQAMSIHRTFTAAILFLLVAATAHAEQPGPAPERQQAREHFERGIELASQRDFEGALSQFEAAYAASPHFAVLYNIAQAQIELGQPLRAVKALERYLAEGAGWIPPEREQAALAQIAEQRAQLGEVEVAVNVTGARVSVDEKDVGLAPLAGPLLLEAGTHAVRAQAPGHLEVTRQITVVRREHTKLELLLPPEPGTLNIVCPEPVGVWANGVALGASAYRPGFELVPGAYRLRVVAPGRAELDRRIEIQPGQSLSVECAEPLPALRSQPPERAELSPSRSLRSVGYVLAGAGLAAGGVALGHYFWNRGRYDTWRAEDGWLQAHRDSADFQARQVVNNDLAAAIDRASRVTVGLGLASLGLVAGGVGVIVVDLKAAGSKGPGAHPPEVALSWGSAW